MRNHFFPSRMELIELVFHKNQNYYLAYDFRQWLRNAKKLSGSNPS